MNKIISTGDVYVLESLPSAQGGKQPGSPIQMNINIQKSQFVAMASVLLANRCQNSDKQSEEPEACGENDEDNVLLLGKKTKFNQKVFFLRQFLASRLYRIYIGNEKVSTENAVENMLRYNYNEGEFDLEGSRNNLIEQNLHVPHQLREMYNYSDRINRECLGQSLLVGMTFIKLCLLKCTKSLQQLNKRSGSLQS